MNRLILAITFFALCIGVAGAEDRPLVVVIDVPAAEYASVTNKLADKLLEHHALPDIPKWRDWVLQGWQDFVKKTSSNEVVKVYCDSVKHLEQGSYKVTLERLAEIRAHVENPQLRIQTTRDFNGLMEQYGLEVK